MDFNSLSIEQIPDLLMYFFQERNLQPSSIDGYKTAFDDKVGNSSLHINKEENLTSQKDRPKGG